MDDKLASRRHFEIRLTSNKLIVRDLNSQNGTRVNGKVIWEATPLRDGDLVEAGTTGFRVKISEDQLYSNLNVEAPEEAFLEEFNEELRRINKNNPEDWERMLWWCQLQGLHQQEEFCRKNIETCRKRVESMRGKDSFATIANMAALSDPDKDFKIEDADTEFEEKEDLTSSARHPSFKSFGNRLTDFGLQLCSECTKEGKVGYHEGKCWGTGVRLDKVAIPDDVTIATALATIPADQRDDFIMLVRLSMVATLIGGRHVFRMSPALRQQILVVRYLEDGFARFAKLYLQERGVPVTEEGVAEVLHILSFKDAKDFARLSAMIKRVSSITKEQYQKLAPKDREIIESSDILRTIIERPPEAEDA